MIRKLLPDSSTARGRPMPATFAGRYLLERAVTEGTTTFVWRAKDTNTGAIVALTFFPREWVKEPAVLADAEELVAELRRVRHPGLTVATNIAVAGERAAFVAPFVEGPTLGQMLYARPSGYFEADELRRWLSSLLYVFEGAHAYGLVHGAVSPDVVVQRGSEMHVLGFGTAAWLDQASLRYRDRPLRDRGSPYLSPSQRRGDPLRAADDVYALGVLLYELLAGSPPQFGGWLGSSNHPVSIQRQRRRNGERGGPVPTAWERAILRCLELRERDRLGSVRELRHRLELPEPARAPTAAKTAVATPAPPKPETPPAKPTPSDQPEEAAAATTEVPVEPPADLTPAPAATAEPPTEAASAPQEVSVTSSAPAAEPEAAREEQSGDEPEKQPEPETPDPLPAVAAAAATATEEPVAPPLDPAPPDETPPAPPAAVEKETFEAPTEYQPIAEPVAHAESAVEPDADMHPDEVVEPEPELVAMTMAATPPVAPSPAAAVPPPARVRRDRATVPTAPPPTAAPVRPTRTGRQSPPPVAPLPVPVEPAHRVAGAWWLRTLLTLVFLATLGVGGLFVWQLEQQNRRFEQALYPKSENASDPAETPGGATESLAPPEAEAIDPTAAVNDDANDPALAIDAAKFDLTAPGEEAVARGSAPPPPMEPPSGSLNIVTKPAGADVFLEDEHLGRTPLRTDVLPPGEYVLRLQHRGYHDHEVTVDVEPGTVAEVNTTLARVTGVLQVESNLPAIKFVARSVNADVPPREGVTPTELTLPTGRYVIVFQHTEAAPRHFVVDVTEERPAIAQTYVPPPPAAIAELTAPAPAEVESPSEEDPAPAPITPAEVAVPQDEAPKTPAAGQAAANSGDAVTLPADASVVAGAGSETMPAEPLAAPPAETETESATPTTPSETAEVVVEDEIKDAVASEAAPALPPPAEETPEATTPEAEVPLAVREIGAPWGREIGADVPSETPSEARETAPVPESEQAPAAPMSPVPDYIYELRDVDEPPQLVERINPDVPSRRLRRGVEERVELIIVIDRNGRVAAARVGGATQRALIAPSLEAVRAWRFTPALRQGQPVPVRVVLPLVFSNPNK